MAGNAQPARPKGVCTVLVLDHHTITRYGIRKYFESEPAIEITAETSSCDAAWDLLNNSSISVLLMDPEVRDGLAFGLITKITKCLPETKVLVFSSVSSEWQITEALRCGAHGYVCKHSDLDCLREAIQALVLGGSYLDPAMTSMVIGQLGRNQDRRAPQSRCLSNRETTILSAIARGKRNRDIASDLFISESTVKYHLTSLYSKLRVHNRTEAVKYACKNGIL